MQDFQKSGTKSSTESGTEKRYNICQVPGPTMNYCSKSSVHRRFGHKSQLLGVGAQWINLERRLLLHNRT